jgi:hypothetical protein
MNLSPDRLQDERICSSCNQMTIFPQGLPLPNYRVLVRVLPCCLFWTSERDRLLCFGFPCLSSQYQSSTEQGYITCRSDRTSIQPSDLGLIVDTVQHYRRGKNTNNVQQWTNSVQEATQVEKLSCTLGARFNIFHNKILCSRITIKVPPPYLFHVIQRHGIINIRRLNTTVAQLLLVTRCNTNRVSFRKVVYSNRRDE